MAVGNFIFRAVGLAAFSIAILTTGCTDSLFESDSVELSADGKMVPSKIRHASFTSEATKFGKDGAEISLNVSTMSKLAVIERYSIVERYKVVERYDYGSTIPGGSNITVIDETGEGNFQTLFDMFDADADIIWYEPDFSIESPKASQLTTSNGEVVPWGVAAVGGKTAWKVGTRALSNLHVYVVDSGIDSDDLNVVERVDFQRDGFKGDPDGHGTHVAGLIAAKDNSTGIMGVAPGAQVHDFRVLDSNGNADVSVVIAAVEKITQVKLANPVMAIVVNMSLGENIGTTQFTALDEAIATSIEAGVHYVVAAGNSGMDADYFTPAHVPGAITVGSYGQGSTRYSSQLFSIASLISTNTFSSFSNYGSSIDVLAPGEKLTSLAPTGLGVQSGTSMAAAHVTGIVARHIANNPRITPENMQQIVKKGSTLEVSGVPAGTSADGARIITR